MAKQELRVGDEVWVSYEDAVGVVREVRKYKGEIVEVVVGGLGTPHPWHCPPDQVHRIDEQTQQQRRQLLGEYLLVDEEDERGDEKELIAGRLGARSLGDAAEEGQGNKDEMYQSIVDGLRKLHKLDWAVLDDQEQVNLDRTLRRVDDLVWEAVHYLVEDE